MKPVFFTRVLLLLALLFGISTAQYAQSNSRESIKGPKVENKKIKKTSQNPAKISPKKTPVTQNAAPCDEDLTAPAIQCVSNCQSTGRAAYLISTYGEPWSQYDNIYAMENVFGSGSWDQMYLEYVDGNALLTPAYKVIFLEGSNNGGYALEYFLSNYQAALENWVAAGGALFINCAPNDGPASLNLGFGGVYLENLIYIDQVTVTDPAHPVFNGPFTPANGDFTGTSFLHGLIHGPAGQVLITTTDGSGVGLTVKSFGNGKVYFGTMTMPYWHSPAPNAQNLRQNILADLNTYCGNGVDLTADIGLCSATVMDNALDASASDDCTLISLTHDLAGAPNNTTLLGASFPSTPTTVRWTATDAAGNTSTCEILVRVLEPEAPVITCPQDISVNADPTTCGANVPFDAQATDNCTANPGLQYLPASGSIFFVGVTMVQATATDDAGNRATCTFSITVSPNVEICNGYDDDCNGYIDDGVTGDNIFYLDADYDGFGDPNNTITSCLAPYGYVANALDCNDNNYYINPNMYEYCNGIDDNCDGNIDEGVSITWFADADGDGYGDPYTTQNACYQPQGFVYNNLDCDDTEAYIHPGALEDCTNQTDENCDGILGDNNFNILETHTDVFCGSTPDGSISITLAPAQNYPVILWNNGTCCTTDLTNLQSGNYKITVSNECGTTRTKVVTILPSSTPALEVSLSGTNSICGGSASGTITALASAGCGAYIYEWSNYFTGETQSNLSGGEYTVTVTDACGCSATASFFIQEQEQIYVYYGAIIPLLDGTYFVQVLPYGGTSPYQFRRSLDANNFTDWSNSNGFMNVPPGTYTFEVLDNNDCAATLEITLDPFSPGALNTPAVQSVADLSTEAEAISDKISNENDLFTGTKVVKNFGQAVSVYPNPSTGVFNLQLEKAATPEMRFAVTDLTGRLLIENQAVTGSASQSIQIEHLPSGIYLLQVLEMGQVVAVEKLIKE